MLPYQRPPEAEARMSTREKVEWAVIILGVVAWWPKIFLRDYSFVYHPAYNFLCYAVVPLALLFIFVRRVILFRRFVEDEERKRDEAEERARQARERAKRSSDEG
ncbi:MAG: hypothetical protein ACE5O2_16960 [Armatimonadota bacterium]